MDISGLKESLGEQYEPLTTYIDDLIGQRDAARDESIKGRKGLKAKVQELEQAQAGLMERLGIDSLDDLDTLPDVKGQADAVKQYEVKLKRMERELQSRDDRVQELEGRHRDSMLDASLQKAISGHSFVDQELVAEFIKSRVTWEDDQPMFTADGKLLPLDEGATLLAKTKPHLLKSQGAGGSGYQPKPPGTTAQRNPWAKESFNLTDQVRLLKENPDAAMKYKAEAQT